MDLNSPADEELQEEMQVLLISLMRLYGRHLRASLGKI